MSKPSTLTPRQRRHKKTKRAILNTARQLVEEKGLDGFSLREIARRIDYSPAGLYEYFDSKEEIIKAVRREGETRLSITFQQIPADLSYSEKLAEISLAYTRFAVENPQQFLLVFNTEPSSRRSLAEPVGEASPYQILLDTVQAALDSGEVACAGQYAAESIAFSLWSFMHGRAMLQLTFLRHFDGDFDTLQRWAIQTFLKGMQAK